MSTMSISRNSGLKLDSGLKQNVLNPRSFSVVSGSTSISELSGSPTTAHQSNGIVNRCGPICKTAAGLVKLSKNISGIKK